MTTQTGVRRRLLAAGVVVAVLGATGIAAALTSGAGWLNVLIDRIAGESQGFLGGVGGLVPIGFAFAAGMASAVNPCGFPLLPTYLSVFLSEPRTARANLSAAARLGRALTVGGTVTAAFVLLFAAVGLPIGLGAQVFLRWLPWVALGLGVVLVGVGGYRLAGGTLYSAAPERLGARMAFGQRGLRSYFAFGLAYGLASLSCTLPIFLPVVGISVTAGVGMGSAGPLVLYGLGMGTIIVSLTVATALFRTALAARLHRALPYIDRIGTVALFAGGAYLVYYWLTIGGLLA